MTTYSSNSRQVLSMKGTASVPSFSFQGSNKTGWYLSNTNEMSATINGTQYVTINSSGVISNATWGGTTIGATVGGTGQTSYTTGDILYASATNTISKLAAGTNGYFLGLSGGVPAWLPVSAPGSVSSFSAGTTGFTPNTATTGVITLAGTLNAVNGGTGQSTYTTGDILYASATNTISKLGAGTSGQVLTIAGGVPTWSASAGGATGGGTDKIFYLNDQTVTTNYSIPVGQNAGSFGPIAINSSATVTIPSGSVWSIV
jgi:hypothetical protein